MWSVHVAYIVWCGILLWLYSARMWLILVLWSIYDSSTASGTSSTASSVGWHWPSFSSSASHVIISNTSQLQADDLKTMDQTCRHIHLPASFFIRYKIVDLYVEYSYLIPFYKKYNEVTLGSILPTSFWIFVNAWSHICAQNLWNQMLSAFNLHFCNGSLLFFKSTLFLFLFISITINLWKSCFQFHHPKIKWSLWMWIEFQALWKKLQRNPLVKSSQS